MIANSANPNAYQDSLASKEPTLLCRHFYREMKKLFKKIKVDSSASKSFALEA
jgi:hypothetical protein